MAGIRREHYSFGIRRTTARIAESEVKSIRRSDVVKTGLRLFDGRSIGTAGAIGSFDPGELERRALDSMSCGIEYPWEISGRAARREAAALEGMGHDTLADGAGSFMAALHAKWPDLVFSENFTVEDDEISIRNDCGLDLATSLSSAAVVLVFRALGSTGIMDGWVSAGPCRRWDADGIRAEFDRFLEAWHNPVDLPPGGRLPVIFQEASLIYGKLSEELSGHRYGTGASLFSGRMGERLFDERFSLSQSRIPSADDCPFFDAEGVFHEGYALPLIEAGVLRAVCTDRRTAARFGLPHTGSATGDYDAIPQAAADRLRAERCDRTLSDLLGGEPGIFVALASGGDFTPEGAFATPVQLAMLHDGRRFVGRLPELRISSHLFRMLGEDWIGQSSDDVSAYCDSPAMVMRMDVEGARSGV
ncbi:MAG: metallopeptidase TldD-related protein [Candidatus Fermentibacter sp.]|nr:metallopeptidase TldD-related protein [Candidatus Fermentibacter sp.]